MSISVKNKHKSKHEPNDIYIGRGSPLGNPFTHRELEDTLAQYKCETREEAISSYEEYINEKIMKRDLKVCDELNRIFIAAKKGDVNLVCYCKPKSCHGDIIKKIIEEKLNLDSLKGIF
jgi:hypothetical protein